MSKRRDQEILGEITEEEIYEGHTIASALNFNLLGLSASITRSDQEQHFGPVKDLSPLGDMVINLFYLSSYQFLMSLL
jgi:vacuolar protein sorting-associated protein 13A/C